MLNLRRGDLGLGVGVLLLVAIIASNTSIERGGRARTKPAHAVATFGKTRVGGSSDGFQADRKRVSRYSLPVAGTVEKLSVFLTPTRKSGRQALRGVLYADSGGSPGSLLGTSAERVYASTAPAGWYDLTFPVPLNLAAGEYWIGVLTGATSYVAGLRWDPVAGARAFNTNSYASGPSDPFGSYMTDNEQFSIYATYKSAAGTTRPSQPEGLHATVISAAQINLSFSASSGEFEIAGYTIRRDGIVIATTRTPATGYSDHGLSPATSYSYTVEAYDLAGNRSPQSSPAAATTLP
jgi:hypothetical protein